MSTRYKGFVVIVAASLLSTLGIYASDALHGVDTQLTGLVSEFSGPCGPQATKLLLGSHTLCVDVYEASAGANCPHQSPNSLSHTQANLNEASCQPASQAQALPWRFVSLTQAQQLCARAGKRLPTNDEWYAFASGLTDRSACVVSAGNSPAKTGTAGCVTSAGVHDVVGNVWEWVDAEVVDGTYNDRAVPASGYVSHVDSRGVVLHTTSSPQTEFGADYAWTKRDGVFGMIRGGFYGSGDDAGIFAQNLSVPFDFKTSGVGFRCVRSL